MASQDYSKMEMESEPQKSFWKGFPCSRQTGLFVLLGTVCMIIFIIMTSVIFSNQERKFSMLESWMNSHTSDLTSVKSDFQITGNDLEKKVSELQNLVSSLSSSLNTSGSSNPMTNEMHEKLSTIESLMTDLGSSLNSLASKQEEKLQTMERQQNLSSTEVKSWMGSLRSAFSDLESRLTRAISLSSWMFIYIHQTTSNLASSLTNLKSSVEEMRSFVQSLSFKLSLTGSGSGSGCTESDWIPFSKSCYLFSHDTLNWTQAKDSCEKQGALLLKIEDGSEEEWDFVTSFSKRQHYWVGLTDKDTGKWRWADDTPYTINKAHWRTGQPDDWTDHGLGEKGEEGEDCGHIADEGLLNDLHCSSKLKYICEKGMQD
ncbi:asialoglycoprotein receptor 2-like isoform X2 [Pseudorasbora parva]|uniref:asialoglycoprotein receptor 2-like isoform X2 n=1 Tax=Pseudorasbora parva TaxID=51549 RepID=UPI00351F1433